MQRDSWVQTFRSRFTYVSMNGGLSLTEASALRKQTKSGVARTAKGQDPEL